MAQNKLTLRQLEKNMGLKPSKAPKEEKSTGENISSWIDMLKSLDPEQIKSLANKFLGGGEEYTEEADEDLIGTILENVDKDTILSFIDGLKGGKGGGSTNEFSTQV